MTDGEIKKLIADNAGLVARVAYAYEHRGVDLPDLFHAGNLGLIKAAEQWQGAVSFRPFASFHIRQAIIKLILIT